MSTKLTDTQIAMFGAAARRDDRCLVSLQNLKGGAMHKVAAKLVGAGLVKEVKAKAGMAVWRLDDATGQTYALKLTAAGARAIAVEEGSASKEAKKGESPPAGRGELAGAAPSLSAPRDGTKLALAVGLIRRDHGATLAEDHAEIVRRLFRGYLEAGSATRLKQTIDAENLRLPVRIDGAGRSTGGGLFSRGHLYKILSNPIYVGRIAHKGQEHEGQHPPIIDHDLWDRVRQSLKNHLATGKARHETQSSDALLVGKLFDDRGNRMSPTWARKGSRRWRYYVSQAVLQGDKTKAGSVARVSAPEIENKIIDAIGKLAQRADSEARPSGYEQAGDNITSPEGRRAVSDRHAEIRSLVDRVTLERTTIRIALSPDLEEYEEAKILTIPWTPASPYRRREIIQGANVESAIARPMRQSARLLLIDALRKAHRWLDELLADPRQTVEAIASREGKSERSIRMMLSLAFLAPDIVKAAVEGCLPRGFGLTRLIDLPIAWSDQWEALGLKVPGRA